MLSNYYHQRMEERRRSTRLASREYDHVMLRREAELADREQRRKEREERWELEKRERETKLANSSWRERIEISMNLVCFLCAITLLIVGSHSGQPFVLGGSGVTGLLSFFWTLRISSGRRKGSSAGANPPLSA